METVNIEKSHINKLLCAQNGDAALLYLYLADGGDPVQAEKRLNLSTTRASCAMAMLRQLGLWEEKGKSFAG